MKKVTVSLPSELHDRALQRARELGVSLSELVRRALGAWLDAADDDRSLTEGPVFRGAAPSDSSGRHDDDLYGGLY